MSRYSSKGRPWERARAAVLARDGRLCARCGRAAGTVDHIVPKAAGGTDHPENLRVLCRSCNSRLGNAHHPNRGRARPVRRGASRRW